MLDNSLTLYPADTGAGQVLSIIDTDNGVTTRQVNLGGGQFVKITIARSETNENKGLVTDRYLVRVDHVVPDPVISVNPPAVISSYNVFALPRRVDLVADYLIQNNHRLASFLLDRQDIDADLGSTLMQRLLNGET
jgi:hypothetical protein